MLLRIQQKPYEARSFKLCMMITSIERNIFIPALVTMIEFEGHGNTEKIN